MIYEFWDPRPKQKQVVSQEEIETLLRQWYYVGQRIKLPVRIPPTYATVVNFGKKYIQRGGYNHKDAGVFIDFATVLVMTDDGNIEKFYPELYAETQNALLEKVRRINVSLGDLPDTPFWVG